MKVSFKGVKPGGAGGVYFLEGKYVVEIEKVHVVSKRKGGDMFVLETMIRESTNEKRKPNTRCNNTINLTDDNMGIVMTQVMAINGMDPNGELSEEDAADIEALYEDNVSNNSAKGRFVEIEAHPGEMKSKPGVEMIFCRFLPIEDERQEELRAKYKKTDAAA